ncbi:MAG: hypothetical protein AB1762_16470 [Gemmatimonadota bacterium]
MDLLQIVMRVLHVGLGVFWGGTVFFNVLFLAPAIRDAGPDGAKVGAALVKRGMLNAMPIAAIVTILSGLYLLFRASAGQPQYMGSSVGMTYSTGATAAILAFLIGMLFFRPAMAKLAALGPQVAAAPPGEREALGAQLQAIRTRANRLNAIVTTLVGIAVLTMAVGRYV